MPGVVFPAPLLPPPLVQRLAQPGPLEDRRLAAALLALALVWALVWALAARAAHRRGRRGRHPALRRTLLGGGLTAVALLGGLVAVNGYVGYFPDLGSLINGAGARPLTGAVWRPVGGRDAWRSQLVALNVAASALGVAGRPLYVYLPPGYDDPANAERRYGVVYLIHGYPGDASDWPRAGRLAATADALIRGGLIPPLIVAVPQASSGWGEDSECLDAVNGVKEESYLVRAVVAAVDLRFSVLRGRAGRAIGGMSSGGFCALNLALHHLGEFSVALAMEPYGDPGGDAFTGVLGASQALWHANSPRLYLPTMRFARPLGVFLDAGSADRGGQGQAWLLARELAARGQYVALRVAPGENHTWFEARAELPYALVFAAQHLPALVRGRKADRQPSRRLDGPRRAERRPL